MLVSFLWIVLMRWIAGIIIWITIILFIGLFAFGAFLTRSFLSCIRWIPHSPVKKRLLCLKTWHPKWGTSDVTFESEKGSFCWGTSFLECDECLPKPGVQVQLFCIPSTR